MKAIETQYNGYKFRSRLEARWAVFFDTLGIRYEYEKEGYELTNGDWYLPDFWLPDYNYWVEIKPIEPSHEERMKASLLARNTGYTTFIHYGSIGAPTLNWETMQTTRYFGDMFIGNTMPERHRACNDYLYHRISTLPQFLRDNGFGSVPDFDNTLDVAWWIIGIDDNYYQCYHDTPHPVWQYGLCILGDAIWFEDRWGVGIGHVDSPEYRGNYASTDKLKRAYQAARSARFEVR